MRDGAEMAERQIGSRKSRLLLKLLAASGTALLSRDQIAEVLWDGAPPPGADRNIASLISRLRAVLGAGIIEGGRTGYRLGGEPAVSVDLDVAARLCDQAERRLAHAPAVALAAAARAAELLAAGVAIADEPYADWADVARERLRRLLRRARLTAAQAALGSGDTALSARYAEAPSSAPIPRHRLATCTWPSCAKTPRRLDPGQGHCGRRSRRPQRLTRPLRRSPAARARSRSYAQPGAGRRRVSRAS
jgi:hypothetical protein